MSFPRRHSALSGQSETTSTTLPDYRDYDAIAEECVKNQNLLRVAILETTVGLGLVEIQENQDHVTVVHNLGVLPKGVVYGDAGDDVGRIYYDKATITINQIDIYVANPPIGGIYQIPVFYYYV